MATVSTVNKIVRDERQATAGRRVLTLDRAAGPLVLDIWEARHPSGQPPVLLIHGWGGTGSYWKHTVNALVETVDVIVPDLPGTGRSQPVTSPQRLFDQVDALVDVLRALELDRVQVVAHSMGGAMALLMTERYPDPVERIVLTSLTFFKTDEQRRIYGNVMKAFNVAFRFRPKWLASMPGTVNMMAQQYFYRVPKGNPMLKRGLLDYLELDAGTAMACAEDATDEAIPRSGANVHVPVRLIACRQDQMMPLENVDYTIDIIPDCDMRWIEECGHLPMVEKPDEYNGLLRDFLHL